MKSSVYKFTTCLFRFTQRLSVDVVCWNFQIDDAKQTGEIAAPAGSLFYYPSSRRYRTYTTPRIARACARVKGQRVFKQSTRYATGPPSILCIPIVTPSLFRLFPTSRGKSEAPAKRSHRLRLIAKSAR